MQKINIWSECETYDREQFRKVQSERLIDTVKRVYEKVPHYKNKFDQHGVSIADIKSVDDLAKLPFTEKKDFRDNYPFGLFAVPQKQIVRFHASSGTTGKPTVVGYTKNDVIMWTEMIARIVTMAGVTDEDVAQISFGYGLFTGAFGLHQGLEHIGATVIPMSSGNTEKQIMIMQDYKSTVLVSTPSYALELAARMEEMGVNPQSLSLRFGLFGGEPWSESMRNEIERRLSISATDNYGLSEVIGPGIAGECSHKNGMHIYEDAFLPEIINPDTGAVLPPGAEGELVITTLAKEAYPMIRYRTRDITSLDYSICPCGRTLVRMKRVMRRSDDMLIIRGVNVYPSQIEEAIFSVAKSEAPYQIIVQRTCAMDSMEIVIEITDKIFALELQKQRSFLEQVKKRINSVAGINVSVKLVEAKSLPRQDGKIARVLDKRKI